MTSNTDPDETAKAEQQEQLKGGAGAERQSPSEQLTQSPPTYRHRHVDSSSDDCTSEAPIPTNDDDDNINDRGSGSDNNGNTSFKDDDGGETDVATAATPKTKNLPQQQQLTEQKDSTLGPSSQSSSSSSSLLLPSWSSEQLSYHRARLLRQQLPGRQTNQEQQHDQQQEHGRRRLPSPSQLSSSSDNINLDPNKTNQTNSDVRDSSFRSFASGEESLVSEMETDLDRGDHSMTLQLQQPPNLNLTSSTTLSDAEQVTSRPESDDVGRRDNFKHNGDCKVDDDDGDDNNGKVGREDYLDKEDSSYYGDGTGDDDVHNHGSTLWRARLFIGNLVNHEYVQITVIILILVNAIMMGIATMDFVTDNSAVENVFTKIDTGFLVIFTLEVIMQLFYLGIALFQDAWLIFDLSIVILSWSFESLQIVRAFRIFRAFRLITRVKPLRDLVLAVGAVLPRMYAIAALLMIIFYVFAVLFTELFSELDYDDNVNYFKTLDASLLTCMEMMTLEWAGIARETIEQVSWAWLPFTAFIAISGFIVYNLIVAVVVEAVAVTEQQTRVMDGMQSDSPTAQLEEAQERIDLLRCHLEDMLRTQGQVQEMIERMAGELLYLETERMKAEQRETLLRNEMSRRLEYQRSMESRGQDTALEHNFPSEREKRRSRSQGNDNLLLSSHSERSIRSINSCENAASSRSVHGGGSRERLYRRLGSATGSISSSPMPRQRVSVVGSAVGSPRTRRQDSGTGSAHSTPNHQTIRSNRSLLSRSTSSRSASSAEAGNEERRSWRGLLAINKPNVY